MIFLFQVLAVLAVVFGVAAFLTGRGDGMSEEPQDLATVGIPRDRAMTVEDVLGLRFALAFRGYRMNEVDDALDRLAAEISARDEAIRALRADMEAAQTRLDADAPDARDAAFAPAAPAADDSGWVLDDTQAMARPDYSAFEPPRVEESEEEYVPSDATGDLPADTPVDVPTTPEAWQAATADVPTAPDAETPEFVEPVNPFRPEVPEIPTYDPWSVTPRSRYTEGPTYVEVDDDGDTSDEHVAAIAEHQTGYAPPPPGGAPDADPESGGDAEPGPGSDAGGPTGAPPWQR